MRYDPDTWMKSRYTVCRAGEGYSVEDKKTGERISYHNSVGAAVKARQKTSDKLTTKSNT